MSIQFEKQLNELHEKMLEMGKLCEAAIFDALKALLENNHEIIEKVNQEEKEIDEKEREIETLCMRLLLHQQPVAGDLRTISSILQMIPNMERIGDQAADIADLSRHIKKEQMHLFYNLEKMATDSSRMVVESINAFINSDLKLAEKVIKDDDVVDEEFVAVKTEMAALMSEGKLTPETAIDLMMVAKYFERIGDHATNIGEWVVYSITGNLQ